MALATGPLHQGFPFSRVSRFIHVADEIEEGEKVCHLFLRYFFRGDFLGRHPSPHLRSVVPHQGGQLSLADIGLRKGAEVRASLSAFSPDGMAFTAFFLNKDSPSFLDISRKKVLSLLLGS